MLGLLGAGAVTLAMRQTRQRPPRKTRLDSILEGTAMTTDAPETASHYVEAAGGAGRTQPEPAAEKTPVALEPAAESSQAAPEAGSKMTDAAPFRERDFTDAAPEKKAGDGKREPAKVDQHQLEPDAIAAGGDIGELEGDKQSFGEVPTIMDQDESTPAFAQQN